MPNLNLTITDIMHGDTPVLKIMKGDMQKWPIPYKDQYLTFKALEMGTFQCTRAANYSINGGEWTALAAATDTPTLEPGDKIRWKATNTPNSTDGVGTFSSTGKFNAYGNPLSMRSGDSFKGVNALPNNTYTFCKMFYGCALLVDAKNISLHFTTLRNYCYYYMFYGCSSLTGAPALPVTSITQSTVYGYMFYGCSSLVIAPELPATRLEWQCYTNMFRNCTSLVVAPVLPTISLTTACYNYMFAGCSSLNYIKALFTTTPHANYMNSWVSGVAASGTFVCNPSLATRTRGASGIPSNWTIEEAILN